MKNGDIIYYIGETNRFFTKNKKYVIRNIDNIYGGSNDDDFIYFINDMGETEWIEIRNLKNEKFVDIKKYRK